MVSDVPAQIIRFVCATRASSEAFFASTPLGQSLQFYRTFPKGQQIEVRLFKNNTEGLPAVYNTAIAEAEEHPAILIFCHDDVYLNDFYWARHVLEALAVFDIVGLAGNIRRVPKQASWMYLDDQFTRDEENYLSGVLGHGNGFPDLKQLSIYGEPNQEVKLMDGVFIAVRSTTLTNHALKFDERFSFHFYDLDFCRQAELRNLKMGTWSISAIHASAGRLGGADWREAYRTYLQKYGD